MGKKYTGKEEEPATSITNNGKVIDVYFDTFQKRYFFLENPNFDVKINEKVLVETQMGLAIGKVIAVKSDYKLNIRFLYHILLHFQKEIHNLCSFTGIPALNASELKKLEISIPAIEEQQRIVLILDKFEALTNSITEGLPLAIEQSQKRYEYYRELLLNFPGRE